MPGERVLAMLSSRDARTVRHSSCAAGGLYALTAPLADYVEGRLRARPLSL